MYLIIFDLKALFGVVKYFVIDLEDFSCSSVMVFLQESFCVWKSEGYHECSITWNSIAFLFDIHYKLQVISFDKEVVKLVFFF